MPDSKTPQSHAAPLPETDRAGGAAPIERIDVRRLAHELRTPLSAISALSEIMRDERLGPLNGERYCSYAAGIHDSARHAMSVLSSFLEPGSDGKAAGGLPTDFVELDVAAVVRDSVEVLVPLAERAGVRLELAMPNRLPHLIADRRSLRQILDNLVSNALRFTPPGGRIAVVIDYTAGGPVVIEVADTGDGMTAAELERARAGATAPEPLRRRSAGSGYGLPLVHALAAACGASLTIDSVLRGGTRIAVSFPHGHVVPV